MPTLNGSPILLGVGHGHSVHDAEADSHREIAYSALGEWPESVSVPRWPNKLRERVLSVTRRIVRASSVNPAFERLQALPGIGVLSASAYLNTVGSGEQFKCGRQVSAWLGLVPRQYGSGGQLQLKGITKSGDRYLRGLLIHGARAAISVTKDRESPLIRWAEPIVARRGFNKAVVARPTRTRESGG